MCIFIKKNLKLSDLWTIFCKVRCDIMFMLICSNLIAFHLILLISNGFYWNNIFLRLNCVSNYNQGFEMFFFLFFFFIIIFFLFTWITDDTVVYSVFWFYFLFMFLFISDFCCCCWLLRISLYLVICYFVAVCV